MGKPSLNLLALHLSGKCNLKCKGCTSFSDFQVDDQFIPWSELRPVLKAWGERIDLKCIAISGGEPTMHPDIVDVLLDVRRMFPSTFIDLVTNGTNLVKRPEIVKTLVSLGHACLTVSLHQPQKSYTSAVKKMLLDSYTWQPCSFRSDWLETSNQIFLELRDSSNFLIPVDGGMGNLSPHSSDPKEAFANCCFGNSFSLYQNKLYKCSPLQYLPFLLTKSGQIKDEKWQPYLNYQPLSVTCTDDELLVFFENIDREESVCSMCPSAIVSNGRRNLRGQRKN